MPAMTMPDADPPAATVRGGLLRKLPFAVILVVALAGAFLLRDKLSFAALSEHRHALLAFRDAHFFWSALAFIAAYVGIVAFSLPGATVATLTGGFLFGLFPGVIFNVAAATLGAIAIFLAARAGFGAAVAARLQAGGGAAAWNFMGKVYRNTERPEEALGAYGQALKLDPGNAVAKHGKTLLQSALKH